MDFHRRATDQVFTILCIDDESDNLRILSSVFKDEHKVIACKSGHVGLKKAMQHSPDLILLDVMMPDINGFDLIRTLKADAALKDIPVIFITGLQAALDEEKGLRLGACDYISKPFNLSIVRARVNTHLELLRQRRLLEQFANFDALTGVPNRHKWQNDMAALWSTPVPVSLVVGVADIDFFKLYNDLYGHQQGDAALRKVARVIERTLFDHGGRIYRCGGEEFYFYYPAGGQPAAAVILQACLDAVLDLEIKHEQSSVSQFVTLSIGAVHCVTAPGKDVDAAIAQADRQLYGVKQTTRNGFKIANGGAVCASVCASSDSEGCSAS